MHNGETFIEDAIDSVYAQTYHDIEIIVIDDGSTDKTASIVEEKYPYVKFVKRNNEGVSVARNYGIRIAKGELIAFLDADDKWLPTKLEKQVDLLQSDANLGMVFCEHYFFDDAQVYIEPLSKRQRLLQGNIVKNIFLRSYLATPTVIVKKSVFDDIGLFDTDLEIAEDDNMWMRIAMKYKIDLIDEALVLCRITTGSLSRVDNNIFNGVMKSLNVMKEKYPYLFRLIGSHAINLKKSHVYFSQGYLYFNKGDFNAARSFFLKSILLYPFKIRKYLFMGATLMPVNTVRYLKSILRW